jgi:hypothetical protein
MISSTTTLIYLRIIDEEVIYSQESPNMVEVFKDFDWELDRFVEYRLPIKNHFSF